MHWNGWWYCGIHTCLFSSWVVWQFVFLVIPIFELTWPHWLMLSFLFPKEVPKATMSKIQCQSTNTGCMFLAICISKNLWAAQSLEINLVYHECLLQSVLRCEVILLHQNRKSRVILWSRAWARQCLTPKIFVGTQAYMDSKSRRHLLVQPDFFHGRVEGVSPCPQEISILH